jgi:hypothetical protein
MAKSDMSVDEFLQLCKEVLIHNGYKIIKEDKLARIPELIRNQIVP